MTRSPKQTVLAWVDAFNAADIDALMACYADGAVNHQIAYGPLEGKAAIRALFEMEFARAKMVCQIENLLEDGEWAILEWSDPLGLRGCGFFHVKDGLILHQRGYFDRLSFFEAQGLPLEQALKA
ncbi:nuclear transport factor 2 family protein [Glycocaulis abyssi]|uniref:Nuclear transport factor 2 family protein n=1 Tax=Glycocaulis abyssi TaxID=1433403 RepID=A0ABV9N9B9_9PROT